LTRHELKDQLQHDHFTDAVSSTISYASSHRQTLIRGGIAAVLVLLVGGGIWWYLASQKAQRQQELSAAMGIQEAQVGPPISDVASKYPGTAEGLIAQYYRGAARAEKDNVAGAESDFKTVADSSSSVAPLAKIALVSLYIGEKKGVEAQALLQDLIKDPTPLVSKAQAQILQAQIDETTNPQAAKDALKSIDAAAADRTAVKRAIEQLNSQLAK